MITFLHLCIHTGGGTQRDARYQSRCVSSVDDSLYLPTPEKMVRENVKQHLTVVPYKVCFMDLTRLDKFMKQIISVFVPHLDARVN